MTLTSHFFSYNEIISKFEISKSTLYRYKKMMSEEQKKAWILVSKSDDSGRSKNLYHLDFLQAIKEKKNLKNVSPKTTANGKETPNKNNQKKPQNSLSYGENNYLLIKVLTSELEEKNKIIQRLQQLQSDSNERLKEAHILTAKAQEEAKKLRSELLLLRKQVKAPTEDISIGSGFGPFSYFLFFAFGFSGVFVVLFLLDLI